MSARVVEFVGVLTLAACVVASGVWIVEAEHQSRQLFMEAEQLRREADQLQIDWGRLQIEQGTYATHSRIESLARERLLLDSPEPEQIIVVAGPAQ